MDVILNENQYKKIILEVAKKKIEGSSEENKNLIKRIVSDVKREFKLDLKFILTYSVTIGGLIGPVYEIISSSVPSLSNVEMSLISVGVIMTYYYNNSELLNKILIKIRDNGLINEFNLMLEKAENLKLAFFDFVQSLNVTIGSMSNILAFTFLLGVLSTLVNFAENDFTNLETNKLIMSLMGYFGTLASKHITKELLTKMIERFKSKK